MLATRSRAWALALVTLLALATWSGAQGAGFAPEFTPKPGNEWWLQVGVRADRSLAGVDARVGAGDWKPLALQSWGDWAGSQHAPTGSVVQFRARAADGASALSSCVAWPSRAPSSCPAGGPPPTGGGGVAFQHKGGNEWWVQGKVTPQPQAVEAMDTGGAWTALQLKTWGEWAGSIRVEPGNEVRYRALVGGAWTESCWFSHPAGVARCSGSAPAPPGLPPPGPGTTRVVAMGDIGTGSTARAIAQGGADEGARAFIGLGDYYYESPVWQWEDVMRPLLAHASHLVLGNHDSDTAMPGHFPLGTTWSVNVGGARVVGVNPMRDMRPGSTQYDFVRGQLCGAPEAFRVIATHHSWWLLPGARHPGSEFPASGSDMDALVRDCGVDLVLAAHEHNYQRTMRGDAAYVTVGTGGRGLYPVIGSPPGTVASAEAHGRLVLDVTPGGATGRFRTVDGRTLDEFTVKRDGNSGSPPSSGLTTFAHRGGNEWWAQARVDPRPVAVDARATGGAWVALELKSWGEWAGSLHIAPGHDVQFRARHADGRVDESCWFAHPGGAARCGATPPPSSPFQASFQNVRGNAWWVESDVLVQGAALAGVDARVGGGPWVALEKRPWGSWGGSLAAPAGSTVEFRARSVDGATVVSAPYAWPP